MTIQQLKAVYDAEPFRPFVIHLDDGRTTPVESRDFIMASPSGRRIVVWHAPKSAFQIIDLPQVAGVEVKRAGNGSGRRRKKH